MKYLRIKVWEYDLEGSLKDGYIVTERFDAGDVIIEETVWKAPTEYFERKLKQVIKKIYGIKPSTRFANIELTGDDDILYVEHVCDMGYTPIGELWLMGELNEEEQEAVA